LYFAAMSANHISSVRDFSGFYLINRASDDWWLVFYDMLRKKMQRRIVMLMLQNRLPKGNSREVSFEWRDKWIDGLWIVISLLNPFRPQYWVLLHFRGMMARDSALEQISRTLVYTAFVSWHALWFPRGILRYAFRVWFCFSRRTMHTTYITTCVADYMATWDASLQISFVERMKAMSDRAACLVRVRLGHRRK